MTSNPKRIEEAQLKIDFHILFTAHNNCTSPDHPNRNARWLIKRLKMLQNVDEIVDQVKQMIEYYDLDINEVRDVIAKNMVGEQSLPLKSRE